MRGRFGSVHPCDESRKVFADKSYIITALNCISCHTDVLVRLPRFHRAPLTSGLRTVRVAAVQSILFSGSIIFIHCKY